jgi:hypothetical protein
LKQFGRNKMQKDIVNKRINNELKELALSEQKKWAIAVHKSKEKYKSSSRSKNKFSSKNKEYFKDRRPYEEAKGSDFDDYYN